MKTLKWTAIIALVLGELGTLGSLAGLAGRADAVENALLGVVFNPIIAFCGLWVLYGPMLLIDGLIQKIRKHRRAEKAGETHVNSKT